MRIYLLLRDLLWVSVIIALTAGWWADHTVQAEYCQQSDANRNAAEDQLAMTVATYEGDIRELNAIEASHPELFDEENVAIEPENQPAEY
jgi:hypothetical protein